MGHTGAGAGRSRRTYVGSRAQTRKSLQCWRLGAGLGGWGLALAVHAQAVVPPASTEAGRLRERFDAPAAPASGLALPAFKAGLRDAVPEALRAVRVTLNTVVLENATVFTAEEVSVVAAPYLGREVTGAEIFELAQALTTHYRNAGYILSRVVVPPQTLGADGRLILQVVEGYVASVRIEGDARVLDTLFALAQKIKDSRPLRAQDLERYLLLANDLPGVRLRSILSPSQTVGAVDLTLVASVQDTEGLASVDNYGSRYLGANQATLGLTVNQLLGRNDQLRYLGVGSGDSRMSYHQLGYSQVVNEEGLRLGLTVSQARTQPGDILRPFDVRGRSDSVSFTLAYPWVRTRNQSLFARLSYDTSDIDTDILGARTTEDRIRALRGGLGWQWFDAWEGQNTLDVDASQGVGGTSAGDALKSRVGADGLFTKLTFELGRFQPLGARWGVSLGLAGQWTDNKPLLASEQFALGGRRFGRAYEAAELVGDRGLALRVEPRYVLASGASWLQATHLLAFYDIGEVTKVGPSSAGTPASQSLASAGVGARLFMARQVTAQLEAAWPLTRPLASAPEGGKAVRLLGSLTVRF